MNKSIVVVSFPRSGSTFFCTLLQKIEQLKVYLEIFHFDEEIVRQHMYGDWEKIVTRLTERGLCPEGCFPAYKQDPSPFLEEIKALNPDKNVAFKVFPGHLTRESLATCIQGSAVAFLYRDILDAYISNEIATKTGKYANYDTTKERVVFDAERFLAFGRAVRQHFANALASCEELGVTPNLVTYRQATREGVMDRLLQSLSSALGQPLSHCDVAPLTTTRRQDRRSSAAEKVANPEEMRSALDALRYRQFNSDEQPERDIRDLIKYLDSIFITRRHKEISA